MNNPANIRQRIIILMIGLLLGSVISGIGVVLIILTALEGGAVWENLNGHVGIVLFIIGDIMIGVFARKTKSLPR